MHLNMYTFTKLNEFICEYGGNN